MMRSSLILAALAVGPTATAQTFTIVDDGIVIPRGPVGSYYEFNVGSPSVVYNPDVGEFVLYFEYRGNWGTPVRCANAPGTAGTEWGVGRATSPDGVTWTVDPVAALHPTPGNFWDCAAVQPDVVYEGPGQWHMFFKAWQEGGKVCDDDIGNPDGLPDPAWGCDIIPGVGYASSVDGINWSVPDLLPIISPPLLDPPSEDFGWPRVVQVSGTWILFMNYGDNGITVATAQDPTGPWKWEGYDVSFGYREAISPTPIYPWMEDELIGAAVTCHDEPAPDMLSMFFGGHDRDPFNFWGTPLSRAIGFAEGGVDAWSIGDPPELFWNQTDITTDVAWRAWNVVPVENGDYIMYYQRFVAGGNEIGLAYTTVDTNWDLATVGSDICTYAGAAPSVFDDAYFGTEDTPMVISAAAGVLKDDVDHERNFITASLVVQATDGLVVLDPDGGFTYTPDPDFDGVDSFRYNATDGVSTSSNATVFLTMAGTDDDPVALDDNYAVVEDTNFFIDFAGGVLANDFDPDGPIPSLTAVLQTDVSNGTLILAVGGAVDYTPDPQFNGQDSFTYVADNGTSSQIATVTLDVSAVNDAPTASDEPYNVDEDTSLVIDALAGVLVNASDVEGDSMTAELVLDVSNGTLNLSADGSFTYSPDPNFNGADTFDFRVFDGNDYSIDYTATITVNPIEDLPVGVDDAYGGSEDTAIVRDALSGVLANDSDNDGDTLTAVLVTDVTNGVLALSSDGSFTYTPNLNFSGVDTFTYTANDGDDDSAITTVTLTIASSNDTPVATDDAFNIDEDTTLLAGALTGVLVNDNDADGDPLTAAVVLGTTNGTLNFNNDGTFDYTPDPGFNGVDSFTYQANDGLLDSNTATVTITVNSVEDLPVGVDDAYGGPEDTAIVITAPSGVLANDSDGDGDPLTAVLVADVSNGSLALSADGSFTYTPNLNFNGVDSFTYTANDGDDDSAITTVTLTISSSNDTPVAVDDAFNVDEDTTLVVGGVSDVLVNDSDADGDPLTAAVVLGPTNGTLNFNNDGTFDYTPDPGFNGVDSFTYQAHDGLVDSNTATVTITVNSVEDLPVGVDDAYGGPEDTAIIVNALSGVLANDSDGDGDPLTAVLVSDVTNGSLALSADGSFTYTPNLNFNGVDSFTYTANDGDDDSAITTVTLTISSSNDAPVAVDDAHNVDEDNGLVVGALSGVLVNDTDAEGDTLTAALVVGTTNGTLNLNGDGSFDYTPDPGFNGVDSFTYRANDGQVDSNIATVTITVNSVEDLPVGVDDSYGGPEDTPLVINVVSGVLANDSDGDGDPLTAVLDTDVTDGTLILNADGSFTYTPDLNFAGVDSFTYTANDGDDDSNITTVTLTISSSNDVPVATDDAFNVDEDTALVVAAINSVLVNDTDGDGDPLTAAVVVGTTNGTLNFNNDGTFDYTPDPGFNGVDSFTYRANDGLVDSNVATVTITVNSVEDLPVGVDDAYGGPEDTPIDILAASGVLANDSDGDGDPLTAVLVADVSNGTLILNADGSFTYTPDLNFAGVDSFTYTANDGDDDSAITTVTLTISGTNDAPVATDDAYNVDEDTNLVVGALIGVLDNDTDIDGDPLTAALLVDVTNGTLNFNADGSFDYTPNPGFNGVDSFTYRANDGQVDSNVGTVTITVNSIEDLPVGVDDAYGGPEDTPIDVLAPSGVLANDSDGDGDPLTAVLVTDVTNGVLVLNADGSFTYTPNLNFSGVDSFTYTANDGDDDSAITTVTLTISSENDAPVATDDAYNVDEDTSLLVDSLIGVLVNDVDSDGDPLTAALVVDVSNGTLNFNSDGTFDYTADPGFNGVDTFTYRANDGLLDSNVATVSITVDAVEDTPVGVDDAYPGTEDTPLVIDAINGVLSNDSDGDGDPLTAVLDTDVTNGTLILNADGSFTYTPDLDFTGDDTFTYLANDGDDDSAVTTVTLTIAPENDAPVSADDAYAVDEDTQLTVDALLGVLANDTDVDGDPLTATLVTGATNGTLVPALDGSFVYTPNPGFNGVDTFTYMANDGQVDSGVATVTITVNSVENIPVATDDAYGGTEDTVLVVDALLGVLANDTDADGDPLTATLDTDVTSGTLNLNADGSFDYTPDQDFTGVDSFTYVANDGDDDSAPATVTITITPTDDAPVGVDDDYAVDEDTVLVVNAVAGVLANDIDPEGALLTATLIQTATNGALVPAVDGSFTYTPDPDFNGVDTFTYVANDGNLDSAETTVTITVDPINDSPEAEDDNYQTNEDTALVVDVLTGVLANDSDVDVLDVLEAVLVGTTNNGALTLNLDGSFDYTPDAGFSGLDSFTYRATDGNGGQSGVTIVTIDVSDVNGPPDAVGDNYTTDFETELVVDAAAGLLPNDIDPDGDPLTITGNGDPSNGSATVSADGSFTYTPNPGFSGPDTFTYTLSDGIATDDATVFIEVGDDPNQTTDTDTDTTDTDTDTDTTPKTSDTGGDLKGGGCGCESANVAFGAPWFLALALLIRRRR